jgi:hypothetical protein
MHNHANNTLWRQDRQIMEINTVQKGHLLSLAKPWVLHQCPPLGLLGDRLCEIMMDDLKSLASGCMVDWKVNRGRSGRNGAMKIATNADRHMARAQRKQAFVTKLVIRMHLVSIQWASMDIPRTLVLCDQHGVFNSLKDPEIVQYAFKTIRKEISIAQIWAASWL